MMAGEHGLILTSAGWACDPGSWWEPK